MRRLTGLVLALALLPLGAPAQTRAETLADIRAQIALLGGQLQGLRSELVSTGAQGSVGGGSALERMDAIEAELMRLTAKSEELENKINRVVADGTNRLGDLEFRVVELEGGDISAVGATPTLGGDGGAASVAAPVTDATSAGGAELAVSEQADFDRAKAALDSGSFRSAADLFAAFAESYTGGPLTAAAHYNRGEALAALGDTAEAARAYLESFSGAPESDVAPDALYKLGLSLANLGQKPDACVTLGEVGARFPGSPAAGQALNELTALGCL